MYKLHYCYNGNTVTDQVILYQNTKKSDDFLPILKYYENFKSVWFMQLTDYIDRASFDSEFEYKLVRAVDSFDSKSALKNADKKNLNYLGNFNRWFYKILTNWKSNVKTSTFRLKKRPCVVCPICERKVGRIDEEHLQHYKTTKDLPFVFVWEKQIYTVNTSPKAFVTCWGNFSHKKFNDLNSIESSTIYDSEKTKVKWLWYNDKNEKVVICPFTMQQVQEITNEYIMTLDKKHNRYAMSVNWSDFASSFPGSLIQSEVFSLEHTKIEKTDFKNSVSHNLRIPTSTKVIDFNNILNDEVSVEYDHVFCMIDKEIDDNTDKNILKLLSAGYIIDDVSSVLKIDKNEIKKRIKLIKKHKAILQQCLL